MYKLLSTTALTLFVSIAPVMIFPTGAMAEDNAGTGQTATQPLPDAQQTQQPAVGATDSQTQQAPAKPIEGQIVVQDKDSFLASDMMGATVYNASNEEIGDVNDIIINPDGTVDGVVVGVGGFLGMGEKNVALGLDKFSLSQSKDDLTPRLIVSATKEELEVVPSFKTAYAQKLEEENAQRALNPDIQQLPAPLNPTEPQQQQQQP